eukprot:scaffold12407_cov108-Skeletonema_dohrnii-CCMP3373.AAC.2
MELLMPTILSFGSALSSSHVICANKVKTRIDPDDNSVLDNGVNDVVAIISYIMQHSYLYVYFILSTEGRSDE